MRGHVSTRRLISSPGESKDVARKVRQKRREPRLSPGVRRVLQKLERSEAPPHVKALWRGVIVRAATRTRATRAR